MWARRDGAGIRNRESGIAAVRTCSSRCDSRFRIPESPLSLAAIGNPPDPPALVIAHVERAVGTLRHTGRPVGGAVGARGGAGETGGERLVAAGVPVVEGHEHD